VLPSCPLSRAFLYPQPGDAGGRRSAPAVCQSLTSADPTNQQFSHVNSAWGYAGERQSRIRVSIRVTASGHPQSAAVKECWLLLDNSLGGEAGRLYFSPIYTIGPSIPAIQRLQLAAGSMSPSHGTEGQGVSPSPQEEGSPRIFCLTFEWKMARIGAFWVLFCRLQ